MYFYFDQTILLDFVKAIRSKYKWILYLIACYLLIDIYVHKGMLCVLFKGRFQNNFSFTESPVCKNNLLNKGGRWKKAVNNIQSIPNNLHEYNGLEIDIYFESQKRVFLAFHDSSENLRTNIELIFKSLQQKNYKGSIWLDFKNLSGENQDSALNRLIEYSKTYNLESRIIVESTHPELLVSFYHKGFFTCYFVPYFNPYMMNQSERTEIAKTVESKIRTSSPCSLSGYYFQFPFLKSYFKEVPLLTWTHNHNWSLINYFFQKKIHNDSSLLVILED